MLSVLIIGPKFHYFNLSVERAFRALGYDTHTLSYDNPVHPYNLINKVKYKFAKDKLAMKCSSRVLFTSEAERAFRHYQPDVVFVMNGDMLLPGTLANWRTGNHSAKVALWFFDSMTHIPLCEDNIPVVDQVFCYEQTDIPLIRERFGVEAKFLPQAVDPMIYHPDADNPDGFDFDILFAGDLVHSPRRREVVQAVVNRYHKTRRIRIWGEYKPWYKNPLRWLTREHRDIYMNRNASGEELCRDYAHSRVVLNIHHEQQKDGANPKVYEISATGAYQVCDANPYIEQLFPQSEIGLYRIQASRREQRFEDLFKRIDDALGGCAPSAKSCSLPPSLADAAQNAKEIVLRSHTYVSRISYVLECLGLPHSDYAKK